MPDKLSEPLRWRTPKTIFVNSMSDLFHDGVPEDYIEAVAKVMVKANWHTYQVLTKRSARLAELLSTRLRFAATAPHIWWGVSVEDRQYGLPRIQDLQSAPAAVRFCLSSRCWKIWVLWIYEVLTGSLPAGRAVQVPDPCSASGSFPSATSVRTLGCRSSSNNGEGCARNVPEGSWTEEPMMSFLSGSRIPFPLLMNVTSGWLRSRGDGYQQLDDKN